ncbi:MAG: UDPGP type 1 family protein [Lachnospiraceae bacterium]|nr:UDPGP type 1 family protein [Lachnospiraceae bacterium]MBQ2406018.1 UDPGP type 1 family protein [Lachnospiraceae bacterium]MBQ5849972.1 UDPGP type 1 family protein [Lachnospiraceae bacterium]MEE0920800.1 UDPGP type 1 family protein [Lachnospiraceae bacterium]
MNDNELMNVLKEHGQEHIYEAYQKLDEAGKAKLAAQVEKIDWSMVAMAGHEELAQERGKLEPLSALEVKDIEADKAKYEQVGIEAIKASKVGAVLLAGGQGTRLGSDGPKGKYNIGITKDVYIFERLIRNLLDVTDKAGCFVPLYIMTSDKNNDETIAFFEEKNYFGYPKDFVKFFKQEMAPSVDFDGKLLMEAADSLSLSPNGNGGWFYSMAVTGVLNDVKERGIEWLNIFAVDNVLQRIADPVFVGATIDSGRVSGAKVVRKADPNEKVGVLCLEDGKPSIVEYYEMTEEIINSREANGELSYNFGVILNYLFRVDKLEEIMNANMPVHVVEKKIPYIDKAGNIVKPETPNGYKFELLVLDMIHLLDNCLSFEVVRNYEFAPIKNKTGVDSVESAQALLKENGVEL